MSVNLVPCFPVLGSCFPIPGSWFTVPGFRFLVPCFLVSQFPIPGTRFPMASGFRYMFSISRFLSPRFLVSNLRSWFLVFIPGSRCLISGLLGHSSWFHVIRFPSNVSDTLCIIIIFSADRAQYRVLFFLFPLLLFSFLIHRYVFFIVFPSPYLKGTYFYLKGT